MAVTITDRWLASVLDASLGVVGRRWTCDSMQNQQLLSTSRKSYPDISMRRNQVLEPAISDDAMLS